MISRFLAWVQRLLARFFALFKYQNVKADVVTPAEVDSKAVVPQTDALMVASIAGLAAQIKEPGISLNAVFRKGVWDGTPESWGLRDIKAALMSPDGRDQFLYRNIKFHRELKGIDWYLAPNKRGRLFNLSNGGADQARALSKEEKQAIQQDPTSRHNFYIIFKIFLDLHQSNDYYKVRVDKFFWAAFEFYRLQDDPKYQGWMKDHAVPFFNQYAAAVGKGYSAYLESNRDDYYHRINSGSAAKNFGS